MAENIVSVCVGDRVGFLVAKKVLDRRVKYQCIICGSVGVADESRFSSGSATPRGRCCVHKQIRTRKLPEYEIWKAVKQRCFNPKSKSYKNYGARGITMHPAWIDSFHEFILDVGMRPSPELTLDRINNNGNYEPGNVRWATRLEQSHNTRRTHFITYKGETKPLKEWAKLAGTCDSHLIYHLKKRSEEETLKWFGL